jgi:ureidoacrylate peracid hydrolase
MAYRIPVEETALLLIDMQNAFTHPEGTLALSGADIRACAAAVENVIPVLETCRRLGIPDIWTLQHHLPQDRGREGHRIAAHTAKRSRVASLQGTWDAEIHERLLPYLQPSSQRIDKHRFGAFYSTRLETLLHALGVRTLIITGTTTNACVDTTVREAYMRDYDIVVVQDCVGGLDPELHRAACRVWSFYCGLVVDAEDLVAHLEGERELRPSRILEVRA